MFPFHRKGFLVIGIIIVSLMLIQYCLLDNTIRPSFWFTEKIIDTVPQTQLLTTSWTLEDVSNISAAHSSPCAPVLIGRIKVLKKQINLSDVEAAFPMVEPGGSYHPRSCKTQRVAIIVPFRDREQHLAIFLVNIHHLLITQQIDYTIYIVEQFGSDPFNRGKLMNIGFVEARNERKYDCYIFHDVDLLPEDDRNLYKCSKQPRHMSVAVNTFNYKLPYQQLFGGVSAMTPEHIELINGFANSFWGWGGEDDNLSLRLRKAGLNITRDSPDIARYTMLKHSKAKPNKDRYVLLKEENKSNVTSNDGLNSLVYECKERQKKKLYSWILVDLKKGNKR